MFRTLPFVLLFSSLLLAQQPKPTELPKVLLLGDSIRMGYAPLVAKKLDGIAVVVHPGQVQGGDTTNTLKNLDKWVGDHKPAVIHWNNGLHDLKLAKATKIHQVPIEQYGKNLAELAGRLSKVAPGRVVFANTTPILDDRHAARKAAFDRFESDVKAYNMAANKVLLPLGVPVHDLHRVVEDGGTEKMLGQDGTHYTPEGYDRLAEAVADCIKRQLSVMNPPRLSKPASGPEAVAAYLKAEKEQDAAVPEVFRKITVPEFAIPKTADEWAKRRDDVKAKVVASLGDMPERPKTPKVRLVSAEFRNGYRLEKLRLDNGLDGEMSAMMLIPDGLQGRALTILWLHSSSYDHTQLLMPNSNGGEEPLGETFVKRGWVVFAPDAAWYGDRAGAGPAGNKETTSSQQTSQHKLHLWFGRTLWGMFVRDDQVALDYLCTRPEVNIQRIGATGISMGSTRSWWLSAVDDRVSCMVGVACLTRYENLIRHGQLKQHGVYYFVIGLLKHFDTEAVVSLIAPRPVLFLTGELDAGSPADGIKVIEQKAGGVYTVTGANEKFRSVRYDDIGHTYTPEMRKEMLAWFEKWLK
jgi:lysophospholipase L1-like esterase/dienelactone hydrolase